MDKMNLIKSFLLAAAAGGIALSASGQVFEGYLSETFVESTGATSGAFTESPTGFPNSWANMSTKSAAPGLVGSAPTRHNSHAGVGAWFEVSPILPEAGASYDVFVTVSNHAFIPVDIISAIDVTGGSGLPATTTAFNRDSIDVWVLVGTLTLDLGVDNPTVRFNETEYVSTSGSTQSFNADGVAFAQVIPEPSTYAAVFGGLALLGAFVYRRRLSVKK